jgi:hypothetical protein
MSPINQILNLFESHLFTNIWIVGYIDSDDSIKQNPIEYHSYLGKIDILPREQHDFVRWGKKCVFSYANHRHR